jgi:hypothetical protein
MGNTQNTTVDMRGRHRVNQGAGDNMWFITRKSDGEKRLMYWNKSDRLEYVTRPLTKIKGAPYTECQYTDGEKTFVVPPITLYNPISDKEYSLRVKDKPLLIA